ncbi:hypothetical protein BH23CHL7_BH23CHL7_17300 [soil metagenome]
MLAVVDALAALLPQLTGVTIDAAATEPFRPAAGRLYLWRRRLVPHGVDDEPSGRREDAVLRMRALVVRGNKGEPRAQNASRATTDALEADLSAIWQALIDGRRAERWWDIYFDGALYDFFRSPDARGHALDFVVRLNDPLGGSP